LSGKNSILNKRVVDPFSYSTIWDNYSTFYWRARSVNINGNSAWSNIVKFKTSTVNGITSKFESHYSFNLKQNYPNPFNPTTIISYSILTSGNVTLKIYDILGREMAELLNEYQSAGMHSVSFDASKLSSGVYFYRLKVNDFVMSKKMILLK
jgi:hypothetical protein